MPAGHLHNSVYLTNPLKGYSVFPVRILYYCPVGSIFLIALIFHQTNIPFVGVKSQFIIQNLEFGIYCPLGNIFLIALIFHAPLSVTTTKVLHIFRGVPSAFCISYLQSTIAQFALRRRVFSMLSVLVPGLLAELLNIPFTEALMPVLHSPVETN